jgi:ribose-phosphate pyrophosphokinase
MSKTRLGDRRVQLDVPDLTRWKDRTPVLLDDIISSARTMALAATKVLEAGLRRPICVGVHGILAADALATLRDAGVEKVVTANTIPHATNEIDVSPLVADGIGKLR